jgi:hypothetical protein
MRIQHPCCPGQAYMALSLPRHFPVVPLLPVAARVPRRGSATAAGRAPERRAAPAPGRARRLGVPAERRGGVCARSARRPQRVWLAALQCELSVIHCVSFTFVLNMVAIPFAPPSPPQLAPHHCYLYRLAMLYDEGDSCAC